MPKPASTRSEAAEPTAPAKSIRALYAEQIAKFDAASEQKDKLGASSARWKTEKQATIETGAIDDDRKVALVATLDVKISMVPFAVQREDGHQRDALAALNELYAALTQEADVHLNTVRDELTETLRSNAAIFCEESDRIDEIVDYTFCRTEYGRRYNEREGERPHGPFSDRGQAGFFLDWFDRCVALHRDWNACALRAGKVPSLMTSAAD